MKIKIEMIPNSYTEEEGYPYCVSKIYIGDDFWEKFDSALNYWTIEDYQHQWKEGLERIKTHDTSCLVASVQNPYISPRLINQWPLYKRGNKIFIQNELIVAEDYENLIGNKVFSPDTCYDFIQPLITEDEDGTRFSLWIINAYELQH